MVCNNFNWVFFVYLYILSLSYILIISIFQKCYPRRTSCILRLFFCKFHQNNVLVLRTWCLDAYKAKDVIFFQNLNMPKKDLHQRQNLNLCITEVS